MVSFLKVTKYSNTTKKHASCAYSIYAIGHHVSTCLFSDLNLFPWEEKRFVPLQPSLPFYLPQVLISLLQKGSQHKSNPVLLRTEFDLKDFWILTSSKRKAVLQTRNKTLKIAHLDMGLSLTAQQVSIYSPKYEAFC